MSPQLSVIIPNYQGNLRVLKSLESLSFQTTSQNNFEVIVVVNGFEGDFSNLQLTLTRRFPQMRLRVYLYDGTGAGNARNIGLNCATGRFITFLDDDDVLEPKFIEVALSLASENTVVVMPLADQMEDGQRKVSSLETRISALAGKELNLSSVPWILGLNASKVVSSGLFDDIRFDPRLKSGEDVVFWANLLNSKQLKVKFVAQFAENSYRRIIRNGSVSRQEESFDFSVTQRLKVIRSLQKIGDPRSVQGLSSLINSQFSFVKDYVSRHPHEGQLAVERAMELGVANLDWTFAKPTKTKNLVISYCFVPYADSSANVMAKRISMAQEHVDVIYANMSRVRRKDPTTRLLVEPWIVREREIPIEASFASWSLICDFAVKAERVARSWIRKYGGYECLYTRSMWIGSHVAGALVKFRNPNIKWIAEFSDPMRFDVEGKPRMGELSRNRVTRYLRNCLRGTNFADLKLKSHFDLVEMVTFAFADSIIFTNSNQRKVMLDAYPQHIRSQVMNKSSIRPHPTLDKKAYYLQNVDYPVEDGVLNIAYFGTFYANRGVGDLVKAISLQDADIRRRIKLHLFSSTKTAFSEELHSLRDSGNVIINEPVPYLKFLNLCTKFDLLLLVDADSRNSQYGLNPFLPSKLSDYRGSGTPILSLVEPGSSLDSLSLEGAIKKGDLPTLVERLKELVITSS